MAKLEKLFDVSTSSNIVDKGSTVPAWAGSRAKSNWWSGGASVDYFNSINGDKIYIQYGQNQEKWASTRFMIESVHVEDEEEQSNGNIKVKGYVQLELLDGKLTDFAGSGVRVHRTISINSETIDDWNGRTNEEYSKSNLKKVSFNETIEPQQKSKSTQMKIKTVYPDGEYSNSTIVLGIALKNPNPPKYIPMAIRISKHWQALDQNEYKPKDDKKDDKPSNPSHSGSSDKPSKEVNFYYPFKDWPISRGWQANGHAGIDYAVNAGTPVHSTVDGTVIKSWFSNLGGGNEVQIWDGSQYTHIFMHMNDRQVSTGQTVKKGQLIGHVGSTGNSTGPHLHWQVNKGKGYLYNHPDSIDPMILVNKYT